MILGQLRMRARQTKNAPLLWDTSKTSFWQSFWTTLKHAWASENNFWTNLGVFETIWDNSETALRQRWDNSVLKL